LQEKNETILVILLNITEIPELTLHVCSVCATRTPFPTVSVRWPKNGAVRIHLLYFLYIFTSKAILSGYVHLRVS